MELPCHLEYHQRPLLSISETMIILGLTVRDTCRLLRTSKECLYQLQLILSQPP